MRLLPSDFGCCKPKRFEIGVYFEQPTMRDAFSEMPTHRSACHICQHIDFH